MSDFPTEAERQVATEEPLYAQGAEHDASANPQATLQWATAGRSCRRRRERPSACWGVGMWARLLFAPLGSTRLAGRRTCCVGSCRDGCGDAGGLFTHTDDV